MTKKEYLNQAYWLDRRIDSKLEQLSALKDMATRTTSVMSGEVEIAYGKETYQLKEGDSIFYDSIVKHHVHGAPGKSAKILAVVYIPF